MSTQSPPVPAGSDLFAQGSQGKGDAIFKGLASAAGITILVALAAVFVFLLVKGIPGVMADPALTQPVKTFGGKSSFWALAGPLVFGTVLFAVIALVIAVPFAIAIALFITYYAPARIATPVAYVIDLLAAVPSIIYGLWGGTVLAASLKPTIEWLSVHASWIPIFKGPYAGTGQVGITAVLVLSVMILPIIVAISREVFKQTPPLVQEAAVGLGATRWEMIRLAVLPHAKSGIVAGVMLGLGRALGETMAVLMVSHALNPNLTFNLTGSHEGQTIASFIAGHWAEASNDGKSALIALGLILFALTFVVNFVARWVIARGDRKFAR
ncbi:phosphate ABC transporter permease subunit PstC [Nocardioides maradonensis]